MILLLVASAHAAEPVSLGVGDAMRLAVANNPDHHSAQLAQQVADIAAHRARLDRFSVTAGASGSGDLGVVKPWGEDAYTAADASWDLRADATVPLYAGGAVRANIAGADAAATAAALDVALTDRTLVRSAYTAYWTIKGYELQIAAEEEGLALTKESLAIIEAKAGAGLAAGIDVNRSRVDVYAQEDTLLSERAALYQAEQDLIQLLHLDTDHVVLTDNPPEPATGAAVVSAEAGANRPELLRKAAEAAKADADVAAARAGTLPSVALTGTAGFGNTTSGLTDPDALGAFDAGALKPQFDASVGVALSWNPFDLFQTRDAVAEARLARQEVDTARVSAEDSIRTDIRKAAARVTELRLRVPLSDQQVALARDNLGIVQGLYGQGSATLLDLFNAQTSFRQARTAGASLRVELATAEADLRWLVGEDLTAPGNQP